MLCFTFGIKIIWFLDHIFWYRRQKWCHQYHFFVTAIIARIQLGITSAQCAVICSYTVIVHTNGHLLMPCAPKPADFSKKLNGCYMYSYTYITTIRFRCTTRDNLFLIFWYETDCFVYCQSQPRCMNRTDGYYIQFYSVSSICSIRKSYISY